MEGTSLREVDTWTLDEIRKYNAVLDWKADLEKAQTAYNQEKFNSK